jgi:hypothetical protein
MATIANRNLIPSNIATFERLFAWCASVLYNLLGNNKVGIFQNEPPTQQVSITTITGTDGKDYWYITAFLPYSFVDMNGPEKPWMAVASVVEAAPHANLTSN